MVTVIIASYNGSKTLPLVLDAYTRLQAPECGWKLVVVDNASTDNSAALIKSYQDKLPLTYLFEGRQGKNVALNQALAHVEGDLVIFSDDDAIPASDWMCQLIACAREHPEYDLFGGLIVPRWPGRPEPWILDWVPMGVTFAIHERVQNGPISPGMIWGPSMMVRAAIFERGERFDESIGPNGGQYPMGSETSFNEMLGRQGSLAWLCKDAQVEHIIRLHQLEREWVLQRAHKFGRGQYLKERDEWPAAMPLWRGIPRWKWRKLVAQHWRRLKGYLLRNPREVFKASWEIRYLEGYIFQARQKCVADS